MTLFVIAAVLWIGAGVLGFFVGRSGTSPGCLVFGLIFIVTGGLGLAFFILGSVLGRNTRRDEMRAERRGSGPAVGTTSHPPISPPALPMGVAPPGRLGVVSGPAPGWFPDAANPYVQRYWDGARWAHQLRWDGSAWVPFE